ncbi:hypothetical protein EVAR_72568_1 [Eumeta japonica]|uniref:Uncharacterized protein n=1 Tax=Eumeta variegata TaxID=151549 RepID=A0A4C1SZD0_EUMVA|nr:hypothetical protein EVAR_72568_1 [Eumeta japonica]
MRVYGCGSNISGREHFAARLFALNSSRGHTLVWHPARHIVGRKECGLTTPAACAGNTGPEVTACRRTERRDADGCILSKNLTPTSLILGSLSAFEAYLDGASGGERAGAYCARIFPRVTCQISQRDDDGAGRGKRKRPGGGCSEGVRGEP